MCSASLTFWQGPTVLAPDVLPDICLFSPRDWGSNFLLTYGDVSCLLTIITLAGGDVKVQQNPLIQVALLKEEVSIPCEVTFLYTLKYTKFSIFYYWFNSSGQRTSIYNREENVQIPPGKENTSITKSYNHKTMPLESHSSGTYYCEVQWSDIQKMGNGVYILVRGKWTSRKEGKQLKSSWPLLWKDDLCFSFPLPKQAMKSGGNNTWCPMLKAIRVECALYRAHRNASPFSMWLQGVGCSVDAQPRKQGRASGQDKRNATRPCMLLTGRICIAERWIWKTS